MCVVQAEPPKPKVSDPDKEKPAGPILLLDAQRTLGLSVGFNNLGLSQGG